MNSTYPVTQRAHTPRALMTAVLVWASLAFSPTFLEAASSSIEIKSYRPPVQVQRAKVEDKTKWFPVRVGLRLEEGDVLKTGKGAKADLKLADGSKMVLGPNTQLAIHEMGKSHSFGLNFGRLRSVVKKLKGGDKFQVKTPLAAASVRGTVFDIGYDADTNTGFLDVLRGAVALLKEGQEILVPAGRRLDFLSDQPLGEPVPRKAESAAPGSDQRAQIRHEVGLSMSKEAVMAAAAEEMRLAEYQEGKTLIDVGGNRVRLAEYIIRRPAELAAADRDKAFKLVVLNERDDRFDYFYYRGLFNTTLPEDLSLALKDINGKLSATAPSYYLTAYEMGQSNTQDSIKDNATGGHLVKVTYDGTNYVLTDPNDATRTRTIAEDEQTVIDGATYHKIYDPVNDRFITLTDAQYKAGDYRTSVYNPDTDGFQYIGSGDTYWRGRYNNYSHVLNDVTKQSYAPKTGITNILAADFDAEYTYAGGTMFSFTETPSGADKLHNRVSLFYGDGTREVYDTYIISDEGAIAPTSAFAGITAGTSFKAELLKWNYQQVATASEFSGRKIDLVVEPKILIKSGLIK